VGGFVGTQQVPVVNAARTDQERKRGALSCEEASGKRTTTTSESRVPSAKKLRKSLRFMLEMH